jgi:hypothetical protein
MSPQQHDKDSTMGSGAIGGPSHEASAEKDLASQEFLSALQAAFLEPQFDLKSAWTGHIPVMFSLVSLLRPRLFVELGVHNGASFFAACQVVKQFATGTQCVGVDHWEGDAHAGIFDDEVFENADRIRRENFAEFATFHRMAFAEALNHVEDASVDLLHIDGFHTYEAVKEDFETWRSKLSPQAVVLFHDVNEYRSSFGVWRLWQELVTEFPGRCFALGNDHGLGVLFFGEEQTGQGQELLTWLTASNGFAHAQTFFAELSHRSARHLNAQAKLKQEVAASGAAVVRAEHRVGELESELEASESRVSELGVEVEESAAAVVRAEHRVGELELKLGENSALLEDQWINSETQRKQNRQDAKLLQMLLRRQSLKPSLALAGFIEWVRGRKDESPGRRLKEIIYRLSQLEEASNAEEWKEPTEISPSRRAGQNSTKEFGSSKAPKGPASGSYEAKITKGLALMSRGEWVGALGVWDGLLAVLVGERLQVPRAGRVVCGWLTDPVGFRSELAVAQRLVAGSGVVTDTVVCSAVVGGHDVSWPAGGVVSGASYVRFTDDPGLETWGVWSNRPLEFHGGTAVRSARWVKTHPHMLFPDACWVVWVDGNVIPLTGLEGLLAEFKLSGAPMGAIQHPTRITVEQEVAACIKQGKAEESVLLEQLKESGPKPGVGLWETNLLFFDLEHPQLRPLLTRWWSLIEGGSHRDQVSLPYAVAVTGAGIHPILPEGQSTRTDERFALMGHHENAMGFANHSLRETYQLSEEQTAHLHEQSAFSRNFADDFLGGGR